MPCPHAPGTCAVCRPVAFKFPNEQARREAANARLRAETDARIRPPVYWRCTAGHLNVMRNTACHRCGLER